MIQTPQRLLDILFWFPDSMVKAGLALVVLTVAAACRRGPPPTLEQGRALYAVAGCVSCHGPDGHGDGSSAAQLKSPPRDFRDVAAFKNGRTVDDIAVTIANGLLRNGVQMPGFPQLTDQERESLALFVISLGDQAPESTRPAAPLTPRPRPSS